MNITVHWNVTKGSRIPKYGAGKAGKHFVGAMSLNLRQSVSFKIKDTINLSWKRQVEGIIRRNGTFRKDIGSTVLVDGVSLNMRACRDAKEFSNVLANCLLMIRKQDKNSHGNVTVKSVLGIKYNKTS